MEKFVKLSARLEKLEAELAAKKNSSNSSEPTFSEVVKPPLTSTEGKSERKRGAQPGHPRHERPPFSLDEIDKTWDHRLTTGPDCGGRVEPSDELPRIFSGFSSRSPSRFKVVRH